MAETPFITRQPPDPEALDFEGLRAAAIALVQGLSGEKWTDYNLHDPGVTLLEALCYGLSDLAYRTGFDPADYLAGATGVIDFEGLALFRPDQALSCAPVTLADLRRVAHDSIGNLRNLWLEPATDTALSPALLQAFVELAEEGVDAASAAALRQEVAARLHAVFSRHRPLGEDLAGVEFVVTESFGLSGEVEVADGYPTATVLAEVLWRTRHYLSPRPAWRSRPELLTQAGGMPDVFTGPLTQQGVLTDDTLLPWREQFFISELMGLLMVIPGVERVEHLAFINASGEFTQTIHLTGADRGQGRRVARLSMVLPGQPEGPGSGHLPLTARQGGQREAFAAAEMEAELARLDIQRQDVGSGAASGDWIASMLPRGELRPLARYPSVQHHLPDVYGLNAFGVPTSAPALRQAQAMQLKAYLLLHEQGMADFLAQMAHIPQLFAIEPELRRSYAFQVLGDDSVPRVEGLYPGGVDGQRDHLEEIYEDHDNYLERRHRILNRLLAMHGHDDTRRLADAIVLARGASVAEALGAKQRLVAHIVPFGAGRARGGAVGPAGEAIDQVPGLEHNLNLLFDGGLETAVGRAGEVALPGGPIRVVDHILLRGARQPSAAEPSLALAPDFLCFRVSIVVAAPTLDALGPEGRALLTQAVSSSCPAHIAATVVSLDAPTYGILCDRLAFFRSLPLAYPERDAAAAAVAALLIHRRG